MSITKENNDITLGRASVYVSDDPYQGQDLANLDLSSFRPMGNVPIFSLAVTVERKDHFNMQTGVAHKDKSVVTKTTNMFNFTTDNMQAENFKAWALGDTKVDVITAAAAQDDTIMNAQPRYSYVIGQSPDYPRGVGIINDDPAKFIVKTADDATTFVQGVDYTIARQGGLMTILPSGNIVAGTTLNVTYDIVANSRNRVDSGETQKLWQMLVIADNPEGTNRDLYAAQVRISPTGDLPMIGEDWIAMGFEGEVLKPADTRYPPYTLYDPAVEATS